MSPSINAGIFAQLPEIILIVTAILVILLDSFVKRENNSHLSMLAQLGAIVAFIINIRLAQEILGKETGWLVFGGMAAWDGVVVFGKFIILIALFIGLVLSHKNNSEREHSGEFLALIILATVGAMVLASATHLVSMLLGLEILSLPLYTIAAFDYSRRSAREAGLKYLLLGAFASGFVAVGCALYYAGSGTMSINAVLAPSGGRVFYNIGCALILAGLMFKGGMLPFFAWSPDTYEGAPDFAVGLMAALAKAGTFLFLLRFVPEILPGIAGSNLIVGLTLATAGTMVAGNLLALAQTNVKRMLAYSSIAHAGYMFLGILAFRGATSGVLFYLAGYIPILVASFHIVALFPGDEGGHELKDYKGVGYRAPFIAGTFALMLVSLAGLPPTPGFWGKVFIFIDAVDPEKGGLVNLVILAMLVSVVGVYYYLRVIVYMYMREPEKDAEVVTPRLSFAGLSGEFGFWFVIAIIAVLGFAPSHLLYFLDIAVLQLQKLPLLLQ